MVVLVFVVVFNTELNEAISLPVKLKYSKLHKFLYTVFQSSLPWTITSKTVGILCVPIALNKCYFCTTPLRLRLVYHNTSISLNSYDTVLFVRSYNPNSDFSYGLCNTWIIMHNFPTTWTWHLHWTLKSFTYSPNSSSHLCHNFCINHYRWKNG